MINTYNTNNLKHKNACIKLAGFKALNLFKTDFGVSQN